MKLCIRAHDLGVFGIPGILKQLDQYGLDGVQLVCYKAFEEIPQRPGGISLQQAQQIGKALAARPWRLPTRRWPWWAPTSIPSMQAKKRWHRDWRSCPITWLFAMPWGAIR